MNIASFMGDLKVTMRKYEQGELEVKDTNHAHEFTV